jgi:hypothetical protein
MVHQWQSYCGKAFASFELYNFNGNPVERQPQKGDFIGSIFLVPEKLKPRAMIG